MANGLKGHTGHSLAAIHKANKGVPVKTYIDPRRSMKGGGIGKINLKAVAEVLVAHGMDPTEEIVKILRPIDPETGEPLPSKLPVDIQARVLGDLLQYCQPKLKSIEISGSVGIERLDITDDQAKRIAEEFLRKTG